MNTEAIRELIDDLRGTEWNMSTPQELADLIADRLDEALRQSQSLPAGAVAGLVGKWQAENGDYPESKQDCADELEQALQADAREKGDAVAYFPDDWQETLRKYGDCLAYADPDEGRVPLHLATQPAQASEKDNG